MKKNNWFIILLVIMLIGIAFAGCGQQNVEESQEVAKPNETTNAQKKIVIKAANTQPLEHPNHLAFLKFKEIVESKTDNIIVEVYGNCVLGTDREVTEGVQMGSIQIGTCSTANLAQFTNSFLAYDLPFIFPTVEDADKVLDGEIGRELLKGLEEKGLVGLAYTELGYRHMLNSIKPIQKLEDLKNLKVRATASPIHISILEALGAKPTPVNWSELYTALQQGALDGIDQDINLTWTNKFFEVQKYLTMSGAIYTPNAIFINKDFFDGLSPEDQKIIVDAGREMSLYERKLVRDNEENFIKNMKEKGVNVIELTPEEKQRWVDATKIVYKEYEEKIGKEFIQKVQATIAK